MVTVIPPVPHDPFDAARWRRIAQIRRILDGGWERDATERLSMMIPQVRQDAWGPPDLTANPTKVFATELARSYDQVPAISPSTDLGKQVVQGVIRSGHYARMAVGQRDAWACGEVYVRLDLDRFDRVTTSIVHGDRITTEPDPEHPDRPIVLRHLQLRRLFNMPDPVWTWDVFDLTDPTHPSYRIYKDDKGKPGEEVTFLVPEVWRGGLIPEGQAYPYRYAGGEPYIPFVAYRSVETGGMWHDLTRMELVEGTLILSVYYTFFGHILRSASWPQRYMAGVEPMGGASTESTGLVDKQGKPIMRKRSSIPTDPATVVMLQHLANSSGTGQALIGQWQAGGDPQVVIEAIMQYERRLASFAGIAGSDLIRTSGDPRSGFAVHVSRHAVREQMRRIEPLLRRADEELLAKAAALMSLASGGRVQYPEDGYEITYRGVPESPEETAVKQRLVLERLNAGLTDRAESLRDLRPELTLEAAKARIAEIDAAKGDAAPQPLNGAQLQQAIVVVERLTYGEIDEGPARVLLMASGMDEARANDLIRSVTRRERPIEA